MLRRTPPLASIEAFIAIAHAGGLRAGAASLALSPSAASRRIGALEAFLGTILFDRTDSGLRLTFAGQKYLDLIEPAIAAVGRASTIGIGDSDHVVLAASHSLSTRWIMPRVAALKAETGINLEVLPTRDPDAVRSGEAQFGFWGALDARDLSAEAVVEVRARPVMAPRLFDERRVPADEAALLAYPLLAVRQPARTWHRWCAIAGLDIEEARVTEFATWALAYEAAAAGLGVALAIPMMCEAQLRSGTLLPCGRSLPIGEAYKLYRSNRRGGRPPAQTNIIHWLRREARASSALFDQFAA